MVKSGVWNVLFPTSPSVNAITIADKRLAVVKSRKVCWGRRPLLSKRVKIAGQLPKQHNESIIHPIAAVLLSITYIFLCFFNTKTHSFLLIFMGFASCPVIPHRFWVQSGLSLPDLLYNRMYVVMVAWRKLHVYISEFMSTENIKTNRRFQPNKTKQELRQTWTLSLSLTGGQLFLHMLLKTENMWDLQYSNLWAFWVKSERHNGQNVQLFLFLPREEYNVTRLIDKYSYESITLF